MIIRENVILINYMMVLIVFRSLIYTFDKSKKMFLHFFSFIFDSTM